MRHLGTVIAFDSTLGLGSIQAGHGNEEIDFERGAVMWRRSIDPGPGQLLSYEVKIRDGRRRAVNLRNDFATTAKGLGRDASLQDRPARKTYRAVAVDNLRSMRPGFVERDAR